MLKPIYCDNNATTPIDPRVIEVMISVLRDHYGNPASKTHTYGWYAEELVEIAREQVAQLINAEPEEIIFTSGATESINLALQGTVNAIKINQIISSPTEHRATLDTLEELKKAGPEIELVPVNPSGEISLELLSSKFKQNNLLLSLMHANNEIGTIHNIKAISEILPKETKVIFHCDAAQSLGKIPLDVKNLNVDLLSISAHKIYGPKGVGALYIKNGATKASLEPLLFGGQHESGLRSGTLNVAGIVGFGKACQIARDEMETDRIQIKVLTDKLFSNLDAAITNLKLNGPTINRLPGNLNLCLPQISASILLAKINSKIALSTSSACTSMTAKPSHVLQAIGLNKDQANSSIRLGLGRFTTEEEVEIISQVLIAAIKELTGLTKN